MARRRSGRARGGSGAAGAFVRELGQGLLAIPCLALGLLIIAVFFETAAEYATGVWQAVVAFAVALGAAGVGVVLVSWVAAMVVGPMAMGWMGIFSGQVPEEFGPRQHNGARALANLLFFVAGFPLGLALFRHGVREGELNWAIEGLFLAGSVTVLGLLPAFPRLILRRRARKGRVVQLESEPVVRFLVAASLGVGLSLAVSFGIAEDRKSDGGELRFGRWVSTCLAPESEVCPPQVEYTVRASAAGDVHVQQRGACAKLVFQSMDGQPVRELRWMELRRAKVKVYHKETETRVRVLRLKAGQQVNLALTYRYKKLGGCHVKLRVLQEATK